MYLTLILLIALPVKIGGEQCDFACFTLYDPVCASDGRSYSNGCMMTLHACKSGRKLTVLYKGRCGHPKDW